MKKPRQTKGGKALWFPIWIDQFFGDSDLDDMTPSQRDLLFHMWGIAWGSRWPGVIGTLGKPWAGDRLAGKCRRLDNVDFRVECTALCTMKKLEKLQGGYLRIPSVVKRLPRYLRNIYNEMYEKHTEECAPNVP